MPEGPVCRSCVAYKRFKDKCWFYWDNKKSCSNYQGSDFSEPTFHRAEDFDHPHFEP